MNIVASLSPNNTPSNGCAQVNRASLQLCIFSLGAHTDQFSVCCFYFCFLLKIKKKLVSFDKFGFWLFWILVRGCAMNTINCTHLLILVFIKRKVSIRFHVFEWDCYYISQQHCKRKSLWSASITLISIISFHSFLIKWTENPQIRWILADGFLMAQKENQKNISAKWADYRWFRDPHSQHTHIFLFLWSLISLKWQQFN